MTRGGNRATSDIEKFMIARGVGSRAAIKISGFENKLQKEGRKGERFFVEKNRVPRREENCQRDYRRSTVFSIVGPVTQKKKKKKWQPKEKKQQRP